MLNNQLLKNCSRSYQENIKNNTEDLIIIVAILQLYKK